MIELKVNTGRFRNRLKAIEQKLKKLPDEAYKEFVKNTPVGDPARWKTKYPPKNYRPGNARRNTILKNKTIEANYPYAQRLNEGYSTQAPRGMVEPTIEFIRKRFKQIMKGK